MATIRTTPYRNSTILRVNSEKSAINTSPEYQRAGGVWTIQKKQLLIDSIINDYDIPKLYFHLLEPGDNFEYSIIDGRQRLEAIWEFINDEYTIAEDFEFFEDKSAKLKGLSYTDLAKEYPKIKINFDSYILPIVIVETSDIDLIEDMFSRLNEAVPLNAAEKRNAIGGSMAQTIRAVADTNFFKNKVKFSNSRYQHREVAARLLFLNYSLETNGKILDTKKPYLDSMTIKYKNDKGLSPNKYENEVKTVLKEMSNLFIDSDSLLRSQSSIAIYYLLFKNAMSNNKLSLITRKKFFDFYDKLAENRKLAEKDITDANFDYLEFERMSQQGTNDASSIRERVRILEQEFGL
ncbi:MAG: DUF262 domain-containing protein [Bacteroidetes bacterium]|nr:DUF262 domain-containing protein [Bacteroidota bacterium]